MPDVCILMVQASLCSLPTNDSRAELSCGSKPDLKLIMNKLWKIEKKKAQYDNRIRALEDQVFKLQNLVREQHAHILVQNSEIARLTTLVAVFSQGTTELAFKESSTTHTPYQSQTPQTTTLSTPLESTETSLESSPEPQSP